MSLSRVVSLLLVPILAFAVLGCRSSAKPKTAATIDARAAEPAPVDAPPPPPPDATAVDAGDPAALGPDAACPPPHPCVQSCPRGHAHGTKLIDGCQVTVCCARIDAP